MNFSAMGGLWWLLEIKVTHHLYKELDCIYLSPDMQEHGWKNYLIRLVGIVFRRNIGFVYAYEQGADVIATVDDDNIPYENWGQDLLLVRQLSMTKELLLKYLIHCHYQSS